MITNIARPFGGGFMESGYPIRVFSGSILWGSVPIGEHSEIGRQGMVRDQVLGSPVSKPSANTCEPYSFATP